MKHPAITLVMFLSTLAVFPSVATATHDPDLFFVTEAIFPGVTWNTLHGTSENRLYAGGNQGTTGVIVSRTNGNWFAETIPIGAPIRNIWVGPDTVYAIRSSTNVALKLSAGTWSTITVTGLTTLWAVHGISETNILFLGTNAVNDLIAVSYDGTVFDAPDPCGAVGTEPGPTNRMSMTHAGTTYHFIGAALGATTNLVFLSHSAGTCNTGITVANANPGSVVNYGVHATAADSDLHMVHGINNPTAATNIAPIYRGTGGTTQVNPDGQLYTVSGFTANDRWAAGNNGRIIHTTDGGSTWTLEPTTNTIEIFAIHFVSINEGWLAGTQGIIQKLGATGNMQFMDLTVQESWTLLFWLGIMFFGMVKGWPWIAGVSLLAVPMVFIAAYATVDKFAWAVLLLIIAMWIQYLSSGGKLEKINWVKTDSKKDGHS